MEGGLLPSDDLYQPYQLQQQQMMMGWFSSSPPPTAVAQPSYSPANLPFSMDQSLTNLLEKQRNETDRYLRLQVPFFFFESSKNLIFWMKIW